MSDPYVKAFRWASDRIGEEGIVAFVSNNSFIERLAFDGMRKHLEQDFDEIYILDSGGNVRKNPKLSGTTHNVFGIQVGVSINVFARLRKAPNLTKAGRIHYANVDEFWRKENKYAFLEEKESVGNVEWQELRSDQRGNWLTQGSQVDFDNLVPLAQGRATPLAIFGVISNGVQTNRDAWVYAFNRETLTENIERLVETYNQQVRRWHSEKRRPEEDLDTFVLSDEKEIKWSSRLKERLAANITTRFEPENVRRALYRPFTFEYLYFDSTLVHRRGQFPRISPSPDNQENSLIWLKVGGDWPMFALATDRIADQLPQGGSQCFPFYTYKEDGTNRLENITDWALEQFHSRYADKSITKWEIFYYVYALLHHPLYRERYAANLKRELPRIPFSPDF